jgi:hypothetical protein
MKMSASTLSLFFLVLTNCHGDRTESELHATPMDSGVASANDASVGGPAVFLRDRGQDRSTVDVVAMGAPLVYGAAFRVHWDPATLAFDGADKSAAWSTNAIALAKEGLPGELVVTWTEKGAARGLKAADETVLGTLHFRPLVKNVTEMAFRIERSTLRDEAGAPIDVAWRGLLPTDTP